MQEGVRGLTLEDIDAARVRATI